MKKAIGLFVSLALTLTLFATQSTLSDSKTKKVSSSSKKQAIPADWGTYVDKINEFSIRFPPGSTIRVNKSDYPIKNAVHIDIDKLPGIREWHGLGIDVIPNPKRLTAKAFYEERIAAMEAEVPDIKPGSLLLRRNERPITIGKQQGMVRQFEIGDGIQKEVTLAWGEKAYQIGYVVSFTDMTIRQKKENPSRIDMLERIIKTFRPQMQD
ncbi:MAG: hypothetical protein HYX78_10075 [Armatimonadetes bacterium]|nr:hypothetical protein [Armatimonadota bacterium]